MSFATIAAFEAALHDLPAPDTAALAAARTRQAQLTKPPGSLGRLEDIAVFLAGWQAREKPVLDRCRAVVFAGNHGVTAQAICAVTSAGNALMAWAVTPWLPANTTARHRSSTGFSRACHPARNTAMSSSRPSEPGGLVNCAWRVRAAASAAVSGAGRSCNAASKAAMVAKLILRQIPVVETA